MANETQAQAAEQKEALATLTAQAQLMWLQQMAEIASKPKPTEEELAQLREALKERAVVDLLGDMSRRLQSRLVQSAYRYPGLAMAVRAKMEQLRTELAYEQGSPLEQLLIDHLVSAWVRLQTVEAGYQTAMQQQCPPAVARTWERKLDGAHKRYLKAVEALAKVQTLLRRAPVEVSIAKAQLGGMR